MQEDIFNKRNKVIDDPTTFTSYKENRSRLILSTLLPLLAIETVGFTFFFNYGVKRGPG
jgi:hypothetical protein